MGRETERLLTERPPTRVRGSVYECICLSVCIYQNHNEFMYTIGNKFKSLSKHLYNQYIQVLHIKHKLGNKSRAKSPKFLIWNVTMKSNYMSNNLTITFLTFFFLFFCFNTKWQHTCIYSSKLKGHLFIYDSTPMVGEATYGTKFLQKLILIIEKIDNKTNFFENFWKVKIYLDTFLWPKIIVTQLR